jgi:hypothetical protein
VIVLQYRDPVFVIFVGAFSLDVTEIHESVECHGELPFAVMNVSDPFERRRGRKRPLISGTVTNPILKREKACCL